MSAAPQTADRPDSEQRLRMVGRADDLSPRARQRLDSVVRLARDICGVPFAGFNLVGEELVRPVAVAGGSSRPFERSDAMCTVAVLEDVEVYVPDAREDVRFADSRLVLGEPGIRFYAARPVRHAGQNVGTLCVWSPEPGALDDAQRTMLKDLARWVESEIELDQDASEARQVQQRLLPTELPRVEGLDVAAECLPARNIGGDLYDWSMVDGRLQVTLCDVMGKGMTAAVTAAGLRAVLRGTSRYNGLEQMMLALGDSMQEAGDVHEFATLWAARIDPGGDVEWIDAGHGLACLVAPDGTVAELTSGELPLGLLPDSAWTSRTTRLEPGHTLLVMSDGALGPVPDIESVADQVASVVLTATDAADCVAGALTLGHRLTGGNPADDMTAMAVRRSS